MAYRWTLTNLSNLDTEVLLRDPVGWDEGIYSIKRSETYKGTFHEYTTALKFHCAGGGKSFIDNVYETEDIDGRIEILAEYDCDGSGIFDELFTGILDLSSYKSTRDFTMVKVEKSDLLTKLFSRDDINVDLETTTSIGGETITAISPVVIPMHSTEIEYESEWVIEQGYSYNSTETYNSIASAWKAIFNHLAGNTSVDFDTTNPWTEYSTLGDSLNVDSIQKSSMTPILELNTPGIIAPVLMNYEIDFSGTFTDNETIVGALRTADIYKLILYYGKKDSGTAMSAITLYDGGNYSSDPFTDNFNIQTSGSFYLNPGDEVYLAWFIQYTTLSGTVTISDTFTYNRSTFKLSSITKYKPTEAKTVLVHEAFNQVIDSIADSNGNFYSTLFGRTDSDKQTYASDGCGSLLAFTNGLNIREFPDKQIHCSFKDLYDAMDCLENIGAGYVSGKIRVEKLSYFFDRSTKIISLQNVNGFTTSNNNSKYFNRIQIGFQKWESEFHGGLDDVNAKHEYATKISTVKNEYIKLCKYLASTYTIEFTRRKNIEILATEDWRYDNDNFIIALNRMAYGSFAPEIYTDSFTDGTGMDALNTAYNLRLTPKRMLLAHLNIITAGLQLIQGAISFVRGDGNTELSVKKVNIGCQEDYSGQQLDENASIDWNDSNAASIDPLWLTETYSFEHPLTYQQFKTIKANPYGYVEFYEKAAELKNGFIMNMDYSMKTGKTKFELLKANIV